MQSKVFLGGLLALLVFVSSCGEEESLNGDDLLGQEISGTFQVALVAPQGTTPGFTSVLGKVYDTPVPSAIIWEEAASSGDCRLLTPRVPFCESSCGSDAVCVEDGQCESYPSAISVGTVSVDGMQTSFSMDPIAGSYQIPGGVTLAFPAFLEGDDIIFTASGDLLVSPFTVEAKGISPLEVLNDTIELNGEPVMLEWTPPAQPGLSTISVVFDISYHGGTKGRIECECEDTGSLEVAASLLEQLKALGISGFPKVEITRSTTGSADPPNQVDLIVESTVTKILTIPGFTSCNDDGDCSDGQTCGSDFLCR